MRPGPTESPTASPTNLGIGGYVFTDLRDPLRLESLHDRFLEGVRAADPALWRDWDDYRRQPDAARTPVALSNLLVRMASHVGAFVKRLFDVEAAAGAIDQSTRAQDDLFRFKVDFVRRRALPLIKGGAGVVCSSDDE